MGGRAQRGGARTRRSFTHAVHARAHSQTKRRALARTHTHTHRHIHTHTDARTHTNTHAHASADTRARATARINAHTVLAARHARNTCDGIGGSMYMCCDGGRAARANGLKCVRGRVGMVRTPWVSLDYPSSTPPVVPPRVPPTTPRPSRVAHLRRCSPTRRGSRCRRRCGRR
jgi:hypothetical protein